MRALFLATDIYTRGGIARYTSTLATALGQSLGAENVDVLALLDWGTQEDAPAGFRVVGLVSDHVGPLSKLRFAARALRQAWRNYDLLIANHVGLAPVAALIRRCYGTPYWVACHGTEVWRRLPPLKRSALQGADLVLPVSQYTAGMLAKVNGIAPGKMRVLYNAIPPSFAALLLSEADSCGDGHGPPEAELASGTRPFMRLRRPAVRKASGFPAEPAYFLPSAQAGRLSLPACAEEVVQSTCAAERRSLSAQQAAKPLVASHPGNRNLDKPGHCPFLLSVGGVSKAHEYKGVDMVIRAMPRILAAVPAAHYVVVGDGDNRRELEQLAEREGVGRRVKFVGEVRDEELATLYRTCDLFVMPSRVSERAGLWTGEGFGRVYAEAALAAKPVVGSRAGGAAEAVLDGQTGLLVDPLSTDEIAAAAVRLLANPEAARSMGRKAREWAVENFTVPPMQRALDEMLDPYHVRAQRRSCSGGVLTAARG